MTLLANALAAGVKAHGADTVFGLPGGGPNLEVIGAAQAAGLRFVLAHGETAAAVMASTYGMLIGRPAMAIATRGPGAACAANGAAQATLDRFPLLLVTDCVSQIDVDRVDHQRFDQQAMFRPITKWSGTLASSPGMHEAVAGALRLAAAAPRGAVHLDYDPDGTLSSAPAPALCAGSSDELIARAVAAIAAARRPLAIVGLGALDDHRAVRAELERLGCPVLTTYQAAGVLPDGHPQLAGLYTNGVIESAIIGEADLILGIGFDQVEPMPPRWRYALPYIALSEEPTTATNIPITIEVVGPLVRLLQRIGAPNASWPPDAGAGALATSRATLLATTAGGFGPLELATAVAAAAPKHVTATVDAGAHFLSIMPFWPASSPLQVLISNGLATMGFALPAAIAAALARPGRPVVCLVGDGGLAMTLAELETLARLQLPVTVVVFNDAALSLIEIKQRPGQGGRGAVRFNPVNYAHVATAMGLSSAVAESAADIRRLLASDWDRPRLIDARIDPATYPALIAATRG